MCVFFGTAIPASSFDFIQLFLYLYIHILTLHTAVTWPILRIVVSRVSAHGQLSTTRDFAHMDIMYVGCHIDPLKCSTWAWALTRKWALAWDTGMCMSVCAYAWYEYMYT